MSPHTYWKTTKLTFGLSLIILGMLSGSIQASSILASSFGWTGIDDTQALYDAFTANVDTLIVDLQAGDWVSGPLIFDNTVNNKVIIFERNVKIRALEGAFDGYLYNGLLTFTNCSNISLIGYGATLQMNKEEYIALNDGSEWRHVISIAGCNNVKIFGLELLDSGGDGIEISGIWGQPIPSTNIHIKDCRIDNNYRQGISVTSAQNVTIEHCEITNTSGTPPAFGIDLEPDNAYDTLSDITIRNCRITGNEGGGILLSFWKLDQSSSSVSVSISDCYIGSNQNAGLVVDVNSNGPVSGQVTVERCIIENQPGNGIFSNKRESLALSFQNLVICNVGTDNGPFDMPIFIQKQFDYSGFPLGNITFDNILIDDHLFTRNFMNITHWGEAPQVENVSGNFSVYNPNGVTYHIEPPLINVDITVQSLPTLPLAEVGIFTTDNTAFETGEDSIATFTVNRSAADISFPLAVHVAVSGTADNRLDYHYFPRALVIPANFADTTRVITAIQDELAEPSETIDLTIPPDDHYSVSNGNAQLFIGDMIVGINTPERGSFSVFPNPVRNHLTIRSEHNVFRSIRIYNILGQLVDTIHPYATSRIDVSSLSSGVYFLLLNSPSGKVAVRFIKE